MLIRGSRPVLPIVGPLVIVFLIIYFFNDWISSPLFPSSSNGGEGADPGTANLDATNKQLSDTPVVEQDLFPNNQPQIPTFDPPSEYYVPYRELRSVSRLDGTYFTIEFGNHLALNPNIIPHPALKETWIIVAQKAQHDVNMSVFNSELVCDARFKNDILSCIDPPMLLTIAGTPGDGCHGEGIEGALSLSVGPHDARVYYGPKAPYAMFGSNSELTCFGMWMQDLRTLMSWGFMNVRTKPFSLAIELHKPGKYMSLEKNWFIFWDFDEQMYVHHDISPKRIFAKLGDDGKVGKDLAVATSKQDNKCMASLMPKLAKKDQSIHQATNSLSVTLCKRYDPECQPNESNTFVFTIFQRKTFYFFHSDYMPYVMLFQQKAPFAVHGISKKSLWIHGREKSQSQQERVLIPVIPGEAKTRPTNQHEMMYITSMSWKEQGQTYHGYIDDVLFLAFGIEDRKTGGLDILAGALMEDLGLCSEV